METSQQSKDLHFMFNKIKRKKKKSKKHIQRENFQTQEKKEDALTFRQELEKKLSTLKN